MRRKAERGRRRLRGRERGGGGDGYALRPTKERSKESQRKEKEKREETTRARRRRRETRWSSQNACTPAPNTTNFVLSSPFSNNILLATAEPAAVLTPVNSAAFTTPTTFPLCSSRTNVVAGRPSVSAEDRGTETILQAVPPTALAREGMKRVVWFGRWRAIRGGPWRRASAGEEEEEGGEVSLEELNALNAEVWEVRKSERVRLERTVETSEEERMVIVEGGEAGGAASEVEGGGATSTFSFSFDGIAEAEGGGGVGAPEGGVTEVICSHSGSDSIVELIVVWRKEGEDEMANR